MKSFLTAAILLGAATASANLDLGTPVFKCVGTLDGDKAVATMFVAEKEVTLLLDWENRVKLVNPINVAKYDEQGDSYFYARKGTNEDYLIYLSMNSKTAHAKLGLGATKFDPSVESSDFVCKSAE